MFVKGLRKFLYAGALVALAPMLAQAGHKADFCGPPCPTDCAPAPAVTTCKVMVPVCVPETYQTTVTCYQQVTKQVPCTAYRCETVNEVCTRNYTEYQRVCETVMETRCITKKIPCIETRTEMVTRHKCEKVTEYVTKTVKCGHWECCTVPAHQGCLAHLCGKCPDPCATKTVKKWVSECRTECVPVCKTKLVKYCEPVCKQVCTYKCVTETIQCPVQKVRCVPVQKTCTYNVCKKVMVPYQTTKCVTECVPVTKTITCTRNVVKYVEKEVQVCASSPCNDACGAACGCGKGLKHRCGGHKSKGGCCN
jgi:hypothetical protein